MREFKYVISDPMGIHARPAGELVKAAAAFPCDVKIEKDGKAVDAKRIMAVMSLGVKAGMEITLRTEGEQEDAAIDALSKFLQDNL